MHSIRLMAIISTLLLMGTFSPTLADVRRPLDPLPWYFGASLGNSTYDEDSIPTFSFSDPRMRVGYSFGDYLAIEGHYSTGGSNTQQVAGAPLEFNIESYAAGFIRGTLPFNNTVFYMLLGASTFDMKTTTNGVSSDGRENSIAYGAGLELYGSPATAITLEWTRYLHKTDFTYDRFGLGFNTYFELPTIER